jgi:hypothetical protein
MNTSMMQQSYEAIVDATDRPAMFLSECLPPSLLWKTPNTKESPIPSSSHFIDRDSCTGSRDSAVSCIGKIPSKTDVGLDHLNMLGRSKRGRKADDKNHSYTIDDDVTDETEETISASFWNSCSTIDVNSSLTQSPENGPQIGDRKPTVPLQYQRSSTIVEDSIPEKESPVTGFEDAGGPESPVSGFDDARGPESPAASFEDAGGPGRSVDSIDNDASCDSSTICGIKRNLSRWGTLPNKRGTIRRSQSYNDQPTRWASPMATVFVHTDGIPSGPGATSKKDARLTLDIPPCRPRQRSNSTGSIVDHSIGEGQCAQNDESNEQAYSESSPSSSRVVETFLDRPTGPTTESPAADCGPPSKPQRQNSGTSLHHTTSNRAPATPQFPDKAYTQLSQGILKDVLQAESDVTKGSSNGSNGEDSSVSVSLTASEIESHVLARIPADLREKLSPKDWNSIFADLAVKSQNRKLSASANGSSKEPECQTRHECSNIQLDTSVIECEGDFCSDEITLGEVSEVTCPSVFQSEMDESIERSRSPIMAVISNYRMGIPGLKRQWRENLNEGDAPRMPHRGNTQRCDSDASISTPSITERSHNQHSDRTVREIGPVFWDSGRRALQRSVSFDVVQIRHYERVLDLNPATSSGPSLGIGWHYDEIMSVNVLEREIMTKSTRRNARQLILPRKIREDMLQDLGYTSKDVARAIRLNLKVKNQRKQTIQNLAHQKMEEMVESSSRKVRELLRFPSRKKSRPSFSR